MKCNLILNVTKIVNKSEKKSIEMFEYEYRIVVEPLQESSAQ